MNHESPTITVAVDVMGGDHGPATVVDGAVSAARHLPVRVALVGAAAAAQGGPVLSAGVFDRPDDCTARGTDNMQMRFASGLPHGSLCTPGNVPLAASRFIHVEQRRDARRARNDQAATPGRNRDVVLAAILATFTGGEAGDASLRAAAVS